MANVPTDQEALDAIREELASIKVPGAENAEPECDTSAMPPVPRSGRSK